MLTAWYVIKLPLENLEVMPPALQEVSGVSGSKFRT